jgi:hypothetical protein
MTRAKSTAATCQLCVARYGSLVTARMALVALGAALGTALVIGIPTDVVPNPWFGREIGVRPFDVVTLVALSAVTGALVATYTVAGDSGASVPRTGIGSGIVG